MPGSRIGTASIALALVCCALGALGANCRTRTCVTTADCREEEVCVQGLCRVTCRSHADCPSTERCVYGACQEVGDAGLVADDGGWRDADEGDPGFAERVDDRAAADTTERDATVVRDGAVVQEMGGQERVTGQDTAGQDGASPCTRNCGGGCVECPALGDGVAAVGCVQEACVVTACESGLPCGTACCGAGVSLIHEVQLAEVGAHTRIAVGRDGTLGIAYFDGERNELAFASSGGSWAHVGILPAMVSAIDLAPDPGDLEWRLGWIAGTTLSLTSAPPWTTAEVATVAEESGLAIAVDPANGLLHTAFCADGVRYFQGTAGEPQETVSILDNPSSVGPAVAIALDSSGTPHIAYSAAEAYSYKVQLARRNAGGGFTFSLVEEGLYYPPQSLSLVFDRDDRPHMAYNAMLQSNMSLPRYATRDAQGGWRLAAVEGCTLSALVRLALVDRRDPRLLFNDVTSPLAGLYVGYPNNDDLTDWRSVWVSEVALTPRYFDLAIDPQGSWHIALQFDDSLIYLGAAP